MPQNIIDKIWEQHVVLQKPGQPAILGIDLQLTHEVTSSQGFVNLHHKGIQVKYPGKHVATLDHSIPTRKNREVITDPIAEKQVNLLRKNTKDFQIPMYDFESGHQGIVHVIGPELGLTQPGMTIVCGDSHTATHGAFGALAFGIGSTEVGFVLATGCLLQRKPKTMKVEFTGKIPEGVYSKDLILYLISQIGVGGANGYVIEYTGEAITSLSMEARMSICNMSIECGARAGLVCPDEKTFEYIQGKDFAPKDEDWGRAVEYWSSLVSDNGAAYDKEISIDSSKLKPMITWGTNPAQGMFIDANVPTEEEIPADQRKNYHQALDYTKLQPGQKLLGEKIDWVFIGSCTNGRIEDLRIAAGEFDKSYNPNLIIRKAISSDAQAIAKIREIGWLETYPNEKIGVTKEIILKKVKVDQNKIDRWVKTINDSAQELFVAEVENKVVGWCVGHSLENTDNAELAIYIFPEYQSMGIGLKLMKARMKELSSYSKILIECVTYNVKAVSFYKKIGFEIKSEEEIVYPDDKPIKLPVYKMEITKEKVEEFVNNFSNTSPDRSNLQNLVLDLGGVLFCSRYEFLAKVAKISIQEAEKYYFSNKFDSDYQEFWEPVSNDFKLGISGQELLEKAIEFSFVPHKELLDLIKLWRQNCPDGKILYLTNISQKILDEFKNSEFYNLFDGGVADCEVGVSKPDPEILSIIQEKYHLEPSQTVVMDDYKPTIETAKNLGFVGMHYLHSDLETAKSLEKLVKSLEFNSPAHISPNVTMYIVPGSEEVKRQAEEEGLDKIFIAAGADWRMPGCSMCLGMNDDKVPSGARCVSTSNRNFMHRQGPGAITHLVSPATAVKSAIAGKIMGGM